MPTEYDYEREADEIDEYWEEEKESFNRINQEKKKNDGVEK